MRHIRFNLASLVVALFFLAVEDLTTTVRDVGDR
jgi:hypothetical protein